MRHCRGQEGTDGDEGTDLFFRFAQEWSIACPQAERRKEASQPYDLEKQKQKKTRAFDLGFLTNVGRKDSCILGREDGLREG